MPRLQTLNIENAEGKAKELLSHVQIKLGMIPNLIQTMANSPAVVEANLGFGEALAKGVLPAKLREKIALTVSEVNGCKYCLAAHSAVGKSLGLSEESILDSRRSTSTNRKEEAALQFARKLVEKSGVVDDNEISGLRNVGYDDGEIAEIVANAAHYLFTNYFNHVAKTAIDFPQVEKLVKR